MGKNRRFACNAAIGLAAACAFPASGDEVSPRPSLTLAPGKSIYLVDPAHSGVSVEVTAPAGKPLELDGIVSAGHISWRAIRAAQHGARPGMRVEVLADGRHVIRSVDVPSRASAPDALPRVSTPAVDTTSATVLQDGTITFSRSQVSIHSLSFRNAALGEMRTSAASVMTASNHSATDLLGSVPTHQNLVDQAASRVPAAGSLVVRGDSASPGTTLRGPTAVTGTAVLETPGRNVLIQSSSGNIVNWQSFSIDANANTFVNSGQSRAVLNRATGNSSNPIITGTVQSNGVVTNLSQGHVSGGNITIGSGARISPTVTVSTSGSASSRPILTVGPR